MSVYLCACVHTHVYAAVYIHVEAKGGGRVTSITLHLLLTWISQPFPAMLVVSEPQWSFCLCPILSPKHWVTDTDMAISRFCCCCCYNVGAGDLNTDSYPLRHLPHPGWSLKKVSLCSDLIGGFPLHSEFKLKPFSWFPMVSVVSTTWPISHFPVASPWPTSPWWHHMSLGLLIQCLL